MALLTQSAAGISPDRPVRATTLISAIGTPLTDAEMLHVEGLDAHVEDQWSNGISGLLVAGSMGLLQLQREETFAALVRRSVELSHGKGEVLVGAGDCGFGRTRDRIAFLNTQKIDGVVVLAPYFITFDQSELLDHFRALADESRAPLYLYDLPQRTRCKIAMSTVLDLARHPNIRGIKCSDEPAYTRQLRDALDAEGRSDFRIVVAQSALLDVLVRSSFHEHLDGMFALAPRWSVEIVRHAERGEWAEASADQKRLNVLQSQVVRYGVFQAMTALLNARGIPGNFAPRPLRTLDNSAREQFLANPVVAELLG